jgi:hypothetical protein
MIFAPGEPGSETSSFLLGNYHGRLASHACVPKRQHFGVQARMTKMIIMNEFYEW